MTETESSAECDELPTPPKKRHTPRTTKWEIRDERELAGLDESDPVYTPAGARKRAPTFVVSRAVQNLSNGRSVLDEARVNIRGTFTSLVPYSRGGGGEGSFPGERGRISVRITDSEAFEDIQSILNTAEGDDADRPRFLLANVRRDTSGDVEDGIEVSFVFDEESRWTRVDPDQRSGLLTLAENGRGYLSEFVDAPRSFVEQRLDKRRETICDGLDEYSGVEVEVLESHERFSQRASAYVRVSFDHLLLPADIAAVYDLFREEGDAIRKVTVSERGTTVYGVRYEFEVESLEHLD